jgi:hypothetical protein
MAILLTGLLGLRAPYHCMKKAKRGDCKRTPKNARSIAMFRRRWLAARLSRNRAIATRPSKNISQSRDVRQSEAITPWRYVRYRTEGAVRAPLRRDRRTERTAAKRRSDSVYFLRRDLRALREAIRISPRSIIPQISFRRFPSALYFDRRACRRITATKAQVLHSSTPVANE